MDGALAWLLAGAEDDGDGAAAGLLTGVGAGAGALGAGALGAGAGISTTGGGVTGGGVTGGVMIGGGVIGGGAALMVTLPTLGCAKA